MEPQMEITLETGTSNSELPLEASASSKIEVDVENFNPEHTDDIIPYSDSKHVFLMMDSDQMAVQPQMEPDHTDKSKYDFVEFTSCTVMNSNDDESKEAKDETKEGKDETKEDKDETKEDKNEIKEAKDGTKESELEQIVDCIVEETDCKKTDSAELFRNSQYFDLHSQIDLIPSRNVVELEYDLPVKSFSCDEIQMCEEWFKKLSEPGTILKPEYHFTLTAERFLELKAIVEEAIRFRKTFTIRGIYPVLRSELLKRNWVEKYENTRPKSYSMTNLDDLCSNLPQKQPDENIKEHIDRCEKIIMSRLLHNHDVDFFWNQSKDHADWSHRCNLLKLLNRFKASLFTSKEGLALLLQQMYWYCEPDISFVYFPRCYVLGFPEHYQDFVEDFRLTACMSLLKWYLEKYEDPNYRLINPEGLVALSVLTFAIDQCNKYTACKKHIDIDNDLVVTMEHEWNQFLVNYYLILHDRQSFLETSDCNSRVLAASARLALREMARYWPQYQIDGTRNIWLLKPANECQGKGIHLVQKVEDVTKIMQSKMKYVVQKYIERPFLIYKTKFDVRQWFIITCAQPLTIWMYKDSYLRFSSQIYSLNDFHESYHLTNHAVQCKYPNVTNRNKQLPEENMWHCRRFKEYLIEVGHGDKWDNVIYPGMKECIIGSMLACQESMDRRPNTFGIYGADFIIAEDFKPWLLEINSCPNLSPSTSVTAIICPKFLEDVIKVVIDRRSDPVADTGLIELVYKQNMPRPIIPENLHFTLRGRGIFKPRRMRHKYYIDANQANSGKCTCLPPKYIATLASPGMYKGPVIHDLIEEINSLHDRTNNHIGVDFASPVKAPIKDNGGQFKRKRK